MKKLNKEPTWFLSETWGLGINPYNWIIYKRRYNKKTGLPSSWGQIAYYPTASMALQDLLDRIMLDAPNSTDLIEHINIALQASIDATNTFLKLLESLPELPPRKTIVQKLNGDV